MYEFNLDSIEDKPWRKPGADITDYFNYGFNEDTWKAYCEKQRKLRIDNNVAPNVKVRSYILYVMYPYKSYNLFLLLLILNRIELNNQKICLCKHKNLRE